MHGYRLPRCTVRSAPGFAPSCEAHSDAAFSPLLLATTWSVLPWITSKGGSNIPAANAGSSGSGSAAWRPRIAESADAVELAAPGAVPECIATAAKRAGLRVASKAAMLAPADRPTTTMRCGSTGCAAHTRSIAASILSASRCARPERVSYQFQQPCTFAKRLCSGYSTRNRARAATRFMCVLAASAAASCVQPCSITSSGKRSARCTPGGM